jgi:predicted PurR-regulated permease PerM
MSLPSEPAFPGGQTAARSDPPVASHRARLLILLASLIVAGYLCFRIVQPYLDVLAWATVLVVLFYPMHRWLLMRLDRPNLCALLSLTVVIVSIILPTILIAGAVVQELRTVKVGLPASLADWLDPSNATIGGVVSWVEQYIDLQPLREAGSWTESLQAWGGGIASRSLTVVGGVVGGVVKIVLIAFTMFFFFRDGEEIRRRLYDYMPLETWRAHSVVVRTREVIQASVYGTLLLAAIQGALGGLAFWVLGLPGAILWGVVMTLLSIIPMFGAFVIWVPAAGYLALSGSWGRAIALTIWGVLVIGSADNLLRPVLVGNRTRMHELLVFFGVLGGLEAFGFIGLILGPVVIAVTLALIGIVWQEADARRSVVSAGEGAPP